MATIKSQKKRIRQDEKKNLRNKDKKTALRTSIKAILNSESDVEKEQKDTVMKNLDRAYSNGIITKNYRDRNKSRISKPVSYTHLTLPTIFRV